MKRKLFTLAVICAALFTGCEDTSYLDSENVDQNIIFQSYSVTYDAQDQLLSCWAEFHQDNMSGSRIRLTGNSSVTCAKEAMTLSDPVCYMLAKNSANDPGKVSFVYVNNNGDKYVNTLKIKSVDTKADAITLSLDADNTITFKGKKAGDDERFFLIIKQEGREDVEIEAMESNGNNLRFDAEDLSVLSKGTYSGQLSRRGEGADVKAADRGGFWNVEYLSVLKEVTIK